jgi:hypothetical protein
MTRIRDVVQKALTTGYLTVEAENQLRKLLATRYDREDFNAFMTLQEAAMSGKVRQESRERLKYLAFQKLHSQTVEKFRTQSMV